MAITGQLWYATRGGRNDTRLVRVNSDGSGSTTVIDNDPGVLPGPASHLLRDIGLDTAAGFYFGLATASGGYGGSDKAFLVRGGIAGGAPTTLVDFSQRGDPFVSALHVDVANRAIYVGVQTFERDSNGRQTGKGLAEGTGIIRFTYDAAGNLDAGQFVVTKNSSNKPAEALPTGGADELLSPLDFDLDPLANRLYFTERGRGATGLFSLDLADPNTITQVVAQTQFPDDFSKGIIFDVEVAATRGQVFFSVRSDALNDFTNAGIWMVPTGASGATATKLSLDTVPANFFPADMAYDERTNRLYIETEGGSTSNSDDVILVYQLSADGLSATFVQTITPDAYTGTTNGAFSIDGMVFTDLPSLVAPANPAGAVEGGGPTPVFDGTPNVVDFEGGYLTGGTIQLTGNRSAGDLLSATASGGISVSAYDAAIGLITLSGYASNVAYQTVLASLRYQTTSSDPTNSGETPNRTVTVTLNDGTQGLPSGQRTAGTTTFAVAAAGPVNTLPAAQAATEDTMLAITGISVSDVGTDPATGVLTVTLTAAPDTGTLSLAGTSGLSFTTGDGTGDATMTFSGSPDAINAALATLTFVPTADYFGAAGIRIVTTNVDNDSQADDLSVTVAAVADIVADDLVVPQGGDPVRLDLLANDSFENPGHAIIGTSQAANGLVVLEDNGTPDDPTDDYVVYIAYETDFSGTDSFTYTVSSGGVEESATVTVTVGAPNAAPTVTIGALPAATEQVAQTLKNSVTVADGDAGNAVVRATLSVGSGTLTLAVGTSGATLISGNGTSSVVVDGTIAQINALLNGDATSVVDYLVTQNAPGRDTILTVRVDDNGNSGTGGAQFGQQTGTIAITAVNDAPILTAGTAATPATFAEGGAPVALFDGVVLDDPDQPVDFAGGGVSLVTTGDGAIVLRSGSAFAVSGGNLVLAADGTVIGAIAGLGGVDVRITGLTGAATVARVQDLIDDFVYANGSEDPVAGDRIVTLTVNDGGNGGTGGPLSGTREQTLRVVAENDAPTIANLHGDGVIFVEADGPVAKDNIVQLDIGANAIVADIDNADFDGGSLSVVVTGGVGAEDYIYFNDTDPAFGLSHDGATISQGGVPFATIDMVGASPTFTFNANATPERVTQLIRSLAYFNDNSGNPAPGERIVTFTLTDGSGGIATATTTVDVVPVDDAPTLSAVAGVTFAEGDATAALFQGIVLDDPDRPATFEGGGFALETTGDGGIVLRAGSAFAISGKTVMLADGTVIGWIKGVGSTQVLVDELTAAATATRVQDLIDDFVYTNDSDNPETGDRTVTLTFCDGGDPHGGHALGATQTQTLTVLGINDVPTIDLNGAAPGVDVAFSRIEGGTYDSGTLQRFAPDALVADPEANYDGGTLTFALLASTDGDCFGVLPAADGRLAGASDGTTVTLTYDGVAFGTYTVSPPSDRVVFNAQATSAAIQALLQAVAYGNTSDAPPAVQTIRVTLTDGAGASVSADSVITITSVNDAPSGTSATLAGTEDSAITLTAADFGFTDVDGNGLQGVRFTDLPAGSLTYDGVQVVVDVEYAVGNGRSFVYTPLADRNGAAADTLSFLVIDDGGTAHDGQNVAQTASTLTIDLAAVDDDPVAVGDLAKVAANAAVAIDVLDNDTDVDGGANMVTTIEGQAVIAGQSVKLKSGAIVTLNADGTIGYDPNGRFDYLVAADGMSTGAQTWAGDVVRYGLNGGSEARVKVTVMGVDGPRDELRGDTTGNVIRGTPRPDLFRLEAGGDEDVDGREGPDSFLFGATLTAADVVQGGPGSDVVAIQGNYAGLTLGTRNLMNVETLSILTGADTRFGASGDERFSYDLTTVDANVAKGAQLIVNAATLLAGESLVFDGSAETDGSFRIYGGAGADTLTGGANADLFIMADGRFNPGDRIVGGGGSDIMILRGDYTASNAVAFAADALTSVETVTLMTAADTRFFSGGVRYSYEVTTDDGNVAAGATMTINGARLRADETMTVDGSGETDGKFRLFGGAGDDDLVGGAGNDLIVGGLGSDFMEGGAADDVFRFDSLAASVPHARDVITDFALGDVIDLRSIDAVAGTAGNDAFDFIADAAFSGVAGQLRAATLFGPVWLVEADVDGDGIADFALTVQLQDHHKIGIGDFLL